MSHVTVITLVNDMNAYVNNVVRSLFAFNVDFIPVIDPVSAPVGLNVGISQAKNGIIVMCHQDVVFSTGWVDAVLQQASTLGDYGVLGTYGVKPDELAARGAGRVRSGDKELYNGPLPAKVTYLDEHCLIIRRNSGLQFDESLAGFHMYGADLCLTAMSRGMTCWAIDAKVHHLHDNLGNDPALDVAVTWFIAKWKGRAPVAKYRTTCRGNIQL